MIASSQRVVSFSKAIFAAIVVALTLLGVGGAGASATEDVSSNLPPSSRADYHGAEAGIADISANLPASSRDDYRGEGYAVADDSTNLPASSRDDYRGAEAVVAGVQAPPVPDLPFDLPQTFPQ